jgi:hypothetical protein
MFIHTINSISYATSFRFRIHRKRENWTQIIGSETTRFPGCKHHHAWYRKRSSHGAKFHQVSFHDRGSQGRSPMALFYRTALVESCEYVAPRACHGRFWLCFCRILVSLDDAWALKRFEHVEQLGPGECLDGLPRRSNLLYCYQWNELCSRFPWFKIVMSQVYVGVWCLG